MNDKPIATLAPLPGGPHQYLTVLTDMLRWISVSGGLYRSAFIERVTQHYGNSVASTNAYIQTLRKFGLITINKSRQLLLTAEGEAALTAPRTDLVQRLLDRVLPRYVAAMDILAFYASSLQPVHVSDLMAALHDQYPDWQSPAPYQERVRWLVGLDCLQQVDGVQSYVITGLGRDYVARYIAQVRADTDPVADSPLDRLIAELHAAAVDGSQPQRFERAVAEAFGWLGFPVQHLGTPGDTDGFF